MPTKDKRRGFGLDIRSFLGQDGATYIVYRTTGGSFHAFKEVEAKQAARECNTEVEGTTRQMWEDIWRSGDGK